MTGAEGRITAPACVLPAFVLKICGITNTEDARAAVEAGANALGFNFYPKSPRFVTPAAAQRIAAETPGAYLRVGVFVHPTSQQMAEAARTVPLEVVQVHGAASAAATEQYRVWRALPGEDATLPLTETDDVEAYLLDAQTPEYGGSGKTFRWEMARGFKGRTIVAGGLDQGNVAAAIAALRPWGVDACSRLEARPGRKDVAQMRAFLQAAQEAFRLQEMVKV